jgi:hypothetical protein
MTRTRFRARIAISAFCMVLYLPGAAFAQGTQAGIPDFPAYKVYAGTMDANGLPTGAACLCLDASPALCYALPERQSDMQFGLEPKTERVSVHGGGSLILFSAAFSGGGSGTLVELALLRYEQDARLRNLLPTVQRTEQGDQAVWQLPSVSSMPVLVTADYVWGKGETHFAQHIFEIRAYLFDSVRQIYAEKVGYRTSHRYASLDETDQINVLVPERAEILRRLGAR